MHLKMVLYIFSAPVTEKSPSSTDVDALETCRKTVWIAVGAMYPHALGNVLFYHLIWSHQVAPLLLQASLTAYPLLLVSWLRHLRDSVLPLKKRDTAYNRCTTRCTSMYQVVLPKSLKRLHLDFLNNFFLCSLFFVFLCVTDCIFKFCMY